MAFFRKGTIIVDERGNPVVDQRAALQTVNFNLDAIPTFTEQQVAPINNQQSPLPQFTQYVKTKDSATVYGLTTSGQWVAFQNQGQFLDTGGNFQNVQNVDQAPSIWVTYSDFVSATSAPGGSVVGDPEFSTGISDLDQLYNTLAQYLEKLIESGNTINPSVELNPEVVQEFINQAEAEVGPYFSSQIALVKDDLSATLSGLQRQFEQEKAQSEAQFRQQLEGSRESFAGAGLAQSGVRGRAELEAQQAQQRSLDFGATQASEAAGQAVRRAEAQVGTGNLPSFSGLGFSAPTVSLEGRGGYSPGRTLDFSDSGRDVVGSIEYEQRGASRQLSDFLKEQEVRRRSLSFTG